jgi:hypothetical protein
MEPAVFKHPAQLVAIGATAAILLAGCGRQLPAANIAHAQGPHQAMAKSIANGASVSKASHKNGRSLVDLMHQATEIIQQQYPNSKLYEVKGELKNNQMVDAGDFDNWIFGALDDASQPQNSIFVTYKNGLFSAPKQRAGFDYDVQLVEINSKIGLREAIVDLRNAGFNQDFRYADLYKVINPRYKQAFYIFISETVIVTVGAEDGAVTRHRPQDWFGGHHAPGQTTLPNVPLD